MILGVVIDHMTLIKASNGRSKKEEIDAISRDSVQIRNNTKIVSPIMISQFNRNSNGQERMKQGLQDPSIEDYKDSGSLNKPINWRHKIPLNGETPKKDNPVLNLLEIRENA